MDRKQITGFFLVILAAALWATLPSFSRLAYQEGSNPYIAASMRAYLAAAVFLVWFLADGTFKKIHWRDIPFFLLYGIVGVGGTFLFYMIAVDMLSTAMAVILLYTGPSFVIIFSRIFYGERITSIKILALACTFGGCALVVRAYDLASLNANWNGILMGLLAGLTYSMVTVLGRKAQKYGHDGRTNAGLMMIFGSLVFFFVCPPWQVPAPSLPLWGDYLGLALFGSVFSYCAYLKGLDCGLEGGIASLTASVEPVLATILAAALFGDSLEWMQMAGMAVVLVGVALPILSERQQTKFLPIRKNAKAK